MILEIRFRLALHNNQCCHLIRIDRYGGIDVYCLDLNQCLFNDKSLTNKQYGVIGAVGQRQFVKENTQRLVSKSRFN